jgi:DNA-binding NarL/FixJ family response regulator
MTEKIKIALVDDEVLFRKGLELILNQDEALEITFQANNGKELIDAIKENRFVADVILLDLSMPVMDGVDTLLELQKMANRLKIIILTSHYNNNVIAKLIDEGAASFLSKNEDPDITIQTIKNVALRGFHYDDYIMKLFRDKMKFSTRSRFSLKVELSEREIEVLCLICEEFTAKEIADKLFISSRTVEGHRNRMLEKIGAKNTIGLVIYAIEHKYYEVKIEEF